jgi:hypothetical protein
LLAPVAGDMRTHLATTLRPVLVAMPAQPPAPTEEVDP